MGNSQTVARDRALQDITQRISVTVTSQTQGSEQLIQGEAQDTYKSQFQLSSTATLENAQPLCTDNNDPTGMIHVAYQVDRRLPLTALADRLKQTLGDPLPAAIDWLGPRTLVNSQAVAELSQKLTNASGKQRLKLPVQLYRKEGNWYFSAGGAVVQVSAQEFPRLLNWHTQPKSDLTLSIKTVDEAQATSLRLKQGDTFVFELTGTLSCQITLFNIYPDGRIAQLMESLPLTPPMLRIPEQADAYFEAATAIPGEVSQDIIMALCTSAPLTALSFARLTPNGSMVQGQQNYNLDTLISWLDTQDVLEMSSLKLRIDP